MRPVHDQVGVDESSQSNHYRHDELEHTHKATLVKLVRERVGTSLHEHITVVVKEADEEEHAGVEAVVHFNLLVQSLLLLTAIACV